MTQQDQIPADSLSAADPPTQTRLVGPSTLSTPPARRAAPGDGHSAGVPGAPIVKKTERPHPLTPFIRGWLVLVAILVGFGRDLLPSGRDDRRLTGDDISWLLPLIGLVVIAAALVGFVSWYFTRFVIDDEELRVETGAVFKNSKRIPFERLQSIDIIQPLAARLFGLAELRLEVGAGDSTVKLRYLSRRNASQLRDYLLARADGQHATRTQTPGPLASALTDLGVADRPIVTITPQRLVGAFLLSSEWIVTVVITVVALAVASRLGVVGYALPGLIPLLIGAVSMISRRVVAMFHFTLAHSPRGLRVTRGLTNLTSQSVPIDRIQGLKISQPLLWRSCGWYRVDVDIVGYGAATGENSQSDATSVLLPVATADEVSRALDQVLPGVNLGLIELQRSPARARWLHWFGAHTLRYGWDDAVLITEQGLMTRVRNVVPHAKAQSVRIEQGPLQRRLRLADVHIDTPPGPVNAVARELDESTARALALSQLDRARAARGVDRARLAARRDLAQQNAPVLQEWSEPGEAAVLSQFGIGTDALLGSGSESRVFAPDVEHVLRIYRGPAADSRATAAQLRGLYDHWAGTDPGFEIPQIRTLAESGGRTYTVDRRMSGRELAGWLPQAPLAERRAALTSYLDLALSIGRLPSPVPGFARLVGAGAPQQFASLAEVLNAQLQPVMADSWGRLVVDLPDVRQVWDQWQADIATRQTVPAVVHGDLCPANTFCSRGPDGAIVVTGVVDFSPHTVVADPLMDVTGAVCFLELESYDGARDDAAWLTQQAVDRLGEEVRPWLAVYRRFYGFYFSSAHRFDERLYAWCLDQLRPAVSPAHSLPGSLGPPT